jgi:hypothetical protein
MDNNLERQRAWTIRSFALTLAVVSLRRYMPLPALMFD